MQKAEPPNCGLQIADCRLRIADCGLQIADCRLRALRVAAVEAQAWRREAAISVYERRLAVQPQLPRFRGMVGRLSVPIGEIRGSKSQSWRSWAEQGGKAEPTNCGLQIADCG